MDPFISHLVNILSLHQAGPVTAPLPIYDGPSDESTDTILKLLGNLTKRLHDAESRNLAFSSVFNIPSSLGLDGQGDLPRVPFGNDDLRLFDHTDTMRGSIALRGNDTPFTSMVSQIPLLAAPYFPMTAPPPDPLILPPGPLMTTTFESQMSVLEEMRMLKSQIGDIARVCSAIARGDLGQRITTPVQGVVMSQLKDVINNMVDKLGQFSNEVTRVGQGVGYNAGEAPVLSLEGTWMDLACVVTRLATEACTQVNQ